jgi:hypothetical protein
MAGKKKGSAADAITCSTDSRQLMLLRCGRSHVSMRQSSRVCTHVTDWPVE